MRIVLLNEASDEKFTVGRNKFQTLMTRSAKKNRRVLHRQCDLYSLYLWPRVFVTVLNV